MPHDPPRERARVNRRSSMAERTRSAAFLARVDWSYELLALLLLIAETAVVSLVLLLLAVATSGPSTFPTLPVILALLTAGAVTQRAVDAARLLSPQYELITGVALLTVLAWAVWAIAMPRFHPWDPRWLVEAGRDLALFPSQSIFPVWGVVALVAFAWWRGKQRDEPGLDAAHRLLRAGATIALVSLIGLLILTPADNVDGWRAAFLATIGFFSSGLSATALARLRLEEGRGALRLTPRWLIAVFWPILLLVTGSAILTGLFTRSFFETLLWLLTPVFVLGRLALVVVLYVVTAIAYVVIALFSWFLAQLGPITATPPASRPAPIATPAIDATSAARHVPYADQLRLLVAFALVAGVVWLLTRFFWRRRPRAQVPLDETRASVFSWGLVGDAAARLAQRLVPRSRRRLDPLDALRGDPRWQYTLIVRELYRAWLRRNGDASNEMTPAETPAEYARRLGTRDPDTRPALNELTARYNAARYDARPATAADAASARSAWVELQRRARTTSPRAGRLGRGGRP